MSKERLGLSFIQQKIINLVMGAANTMQYGHIGTAVSSMMGFKIKEVFFRPIFMSCCQQGLITFKNWDEFEKDRRMRGVILLPRGAEAIADIGIMHGGDRYWYKNFDPFEDYSRHPDRIAKLARGYVGARQSGPGPKNKQIFRDAIEQVQRKTGKLPPWAYR